MVQRVRVGLGDDADARPARVPEHHDLGRVVGRARDGAASSSRMAAAEHRGVVAELADLGRGLVHESELAVGGAHRARSEQRIGGAAPRPGARSPARRGRARGRVRGGADPAESRPRTSSRSMAESATCTERNASIAAIDGSPPASNATSRAVRRRSRPTAHTASGPATQRGVDGLRGRGASRVAPRPASSSARARRAVGSSWSTRSAIDERGLRVAEQGPHAGNAPQRGVDPLDERRGGAGASASAPSASTEASSPVRARSRSRPAPRRREPARRAPTTTPTMPHMGGKIATRDRR